MVTPTPRSIVRLEKDLGAKVDWLSWEVVWYLFMFFTRVLALFVGPNEPKLLTL